MILLTVWKKIYHSCNNKDSTDETARIRNTHFIKAPILFTKKKLLWDLWGRDSEIISAVKREAQIKVNKANRVDSAFW